MKNPKHVLDVVAFMLLGVALGATIGHKLTKDDYSHQAMVTHQFNTEAAISSHLKSAEDLSLDFTKEQKQQYRRVELLMAATHLLDNWTPSVESFFVDNQSVARKTINLVREELNLPVYVGRLDARAYIRLQQDIDKLCRTVPKTIIQERQWQAPLCGVQPK